MIVTQTNIGEVSSDISASPLVAVDTETTGLKETDLPFAVIIATERESYYFDNRTFGQEIWPAVGSLLANKSVVFQNAKFDMAMLERKGIGGFASVFDTAVGARLVENNHLAYNLDAQAKRAGMASKIDVKAYIKANKLYKADKSPDYFAVPVDIMADYAAHDARLTYDLWRLYQGKMDNRDREILGIEARATHACFRMERHGVCLDRAYTTAALRHETVKSEALRQEFLEKTGQEFVNSAKSLCPLFEAAGEKIHHTKEGNPSLTEDVLDSYSSPLAELVKRIRHYDKRVSTYYQSYLDLEHRGRIHPWMWQAGTRTGRFSYSDPNLQNIPKDEPADEPYHIRGCFVPTPGRTLVSFDYSQQEYRMMLAYANEKRLIDEVMDGKDVHQATADLLGVERKLAKTLNFAILYGAGPKRVAATLGITLKEAEMLRLRYFLALPRVEKLIREVIATAKARGYISTWAGRKLRFGIVQSSEGPYHDGYTAPNHLIQGGAADVVKVAMARIHEEVRLEGSMILQVHDQLVFDLTDRDLSCLPQIKQIMCEAFPEMNGIRLDVDASWSRKSFAERDMEGIKVLV